MSDRSQLLAAWRAHKKVYGEKSAADILTRFGADSGDPSPHAVPDDQINAATAALLEGLPANARASTPKSFADLDVAGIWNRFNRAGRRRAAGSKPA